jgi:hypothetical protein
VALNTLLRLTFVVEDKVVLLIKVKPLAPAACHLSPVASALSATNLIQEQSQRIVLDTGIILYL